MIYSFFYSLRIAIKFYNIVSIDELKDFLKLKHIPFESRIYWNSIVIFMDMKLTCVLCKKVVDNKIVCENGVYDIPKSFICISNPLDYRLKTQLIYSICIYIAIILSFVNVFLALPLLLVSLKLKSEFILIKLFQISVIILLLYNNWFLLIAIIIIIITIKYNFVLFFSLPLFITIDYFHETTLFTLYTVLVICYYVSNYIDRVKMKMICNKLFLKFFIKSIKKIKIDNNIYSNYGVYYVTVSEGSRIYINNINAKFVSLEYLRNNLQIIQIINRNIFFTNKQKYSKIDTVDKYYFYLYERR